MGFFKKEKSLSEIEEETVREDALITLEQKQLIRKEIEAKLGKGGMGLFRSKGDSEDSVFKKALSWLKSH